MLQKEDILLRKLAVQDKDELAQLANNKKIWDNVRDQMPHPYSEQNAIDFINMVSNNTTNSIFAIQYKTDFCGMIGIHPQQDVYRKSAEIGYWIGEPFWGKGIATTAVQLITEYGFKDLDLVRIYAGIFEYNKASMRILEKNGYYKEGISKKAVFKNNQIWDEHRFAIVL